MARAICVAARTSPPGVWSTRSTGTSGSVITHARMTSSESLMSMYRMSGNPSRLIVSCRWTSKMTRVLRCRSRRASRRWREFSRSLCLSTGCRAERTKKSQKICPKSMHLPSADRPDSRPARPCPLDAVLVSLEAPGPLPLRQDEQPVKHDACGEAADVRPERDSSHLRSRQAGERPAQHLAEEPEEEIEDSGQLEEEGEEEDRQQHDDLRAWEEDEVGAQHSRDRSRCSHGGHGRLGVGEPVCETGEQAREEVEDQEAARSHAILDVVAEDPEHPHVADDVGPAAVKEHAGEKRPVIVYRQAKLHRPLGMGVASGHDPENVEEALEVLGPEGQLVEEDDDVDGDERPGNDWRATVRDRIADRDQAQASSRQRVPQRGADVKLRGCVWDAT